MIKTRGLLLTVLICNLENLTHNFFFISEVTRLLSDFYLIFLLRNGLRHYRSIAIRDRSRISQSRDLHVQKKKQRVPPLRHAISIARRKTSGTFRRVRLYARLTRTIHRPSTWWFHFGTVQIFLPEAVRYILVSYAWHDVVLPETRVAMPQLCEE